MKNPTQTFWTLAMAPFLLVGCRQRGWYATHSVICGINDNILLPRGSLWWDCDGWWQHRMYILTKVDAEVIYKGIFSYGMQMCEIQIFRPYCLIYLCVAKSLVATDALNIAGNVLWGWYSFIDMLDLEVSSYFRIALAPILYENLGLRLRWNPWKQNTKPECWQYLLLIPREIFRCGCALVRISFMW